MPESAEEVYARVVAEVGEGGRLPVPPVATWQTFPFDGDLRTRPLLPPVDAEEPRNGEGGVGCWRCANPEADVIWRSERWSVAATPKPTGLPLVLFLQAREHMDFHEMDDELAGEYGRVSNHLHRIMRRLPNIGNVHVSKWGDGSEHLHVWFMARTARLAQTLGSFAPEWDEILPPVPEDVWRADLHEVARKLATHGGQALV
jgi:diadenosine tetraphosphate (Ap4A) HIT family hydrolase